MKKFAFVFSILCTMFMMAGCFVSNETWSDWKLTTAPTQTSEGVLTKTSNKGNPKTYTLPILDTENGYTYIIEEYPNCSETGVGQYSIVVDGQTFEFDITLSINVDNHTYGNWVVTTEPTITSTGLLTKTCVGNSEHTETYTLPALNTNDYVYVIFTTPTCSSTGIGQYSIVIDEQTFEFNITLDINADNHSYGDWAESTAPTTTSEGLLTRICSLDNSHVDTFTLPSLSIENGYTYVVIEDSTATTTGTGRYSITKDGQIFTFDVEISICEHSYGDWSVTTTPTTTTSGLLTRICSIDNNHIQTYILPILNASDYTYVETNTSTCCEEGEATYSLTKDGQTFTFDVTLPLLSTHNYGEWSITTTPTTSTTGLLTRVCSLNSEHTDSYILPILSTANEYTYTDIEEATSTEVGTGRYSITINDQTFTFDVEIPIIESVTNVIDISTYNSGEIITLPSGYTEYYISGINTDIQLILDITENATITLTNVYNANLTKEFMLLSKENKSSVVVNLVGTNTIDTLSSAEILDGLIYSAGDLTITGTGSLILTNNDLDGTAGILVFKKALTITTTVNVTAIGKGIQAQKGGATITFEDADITVLSSNDDAIKSKASITITNSTLILNAKCDGIDCDGDLTINSGTFNITTNGGYTANASLLQTSNFEYEAIEYDNGENEDYPTSAEESYGLYVIESVSSMSSYRYYVKIDEENYSTYYKASTDTIYYDRVGCKGIKADGTLTILGGTFTLNTLDDAIKADYIVISSGEITITTACDGIASDTQTDLTGGTYNITTKPTFYRYDGTGRYQTSDGTTYYKVDSETTSNVYDFCNSNKAIKSDDTINITGGTFTINSGDDAIHSDNIVLITGGTFTIATLDDGLHADIKLTIGTDGGNLDDVSITVTSCYEGVEAAQIYIYSGTINLTSSDDAINAAHDTETALVIYFNGGCVTADAGGDGLDSNGNIYFNGGTVIVYGSTAGSEDGVDADGTTYYNGGTVIVLSKKGMSSDLIKSGTHLTFSLSSSSTGGNGQPSGNSGQPGGNSGQNTSSSISARQVISIKDSSGNTLYEITAIRATDMVTFASPDLTSNSTYYLYVDGTQKTSATAN